MDRSSPKYQSTRSWREGLKLPTRRPCMGISMLRLQSLRVAELRMDECRELDDSYCKPSKPTSSKPSVVVCNVTLSPMATGKSQRSQRHFNRFSKLRKGIRKRQARRFWPFPKRASGDDDNRLGCRHMDRTIDSTSSDSACLGYSMSELEASMFSFDQLMLRNSESRETL